MEETQETQVKHNMLRLLSLTGSFTKPWYHGLLVGYFFQPITVHDTEILVHDTEVLRNLIRYSKVAGHQAMRPWFRETVCQIHLALVAIPAVFFALMRKLI